MYGKANFVLVMRNPRRADDDVTGFFSTEQEIYDFILGHFEEDLDPMVGIPPKELFRLPDWIRKNVKATKLLTIQVLGIPMWCNNYTGDPLLPITKPIVFVYVAGGIVQDITCDQPEAIEIALADRDRDSSDDVILHRNYKATAQSRVLILEELDQIEEEERRFRAEAEEDSDGAEPC